MKDLIKQGIVEEVVDKTFEAAPKLYKIIHQPQPCEDCGKIVVNRVVNCRKNIHPFPHYKTNCNICKLYKNPDTDKFDLNQSQIHYYYRNINK